MSLQSVLARLHNLISPDDPGMVIPINEWPAPEQAIESDRDRQERLDRGRAKVRSVMRRIEGPENPTYEDLTDLAATLGKLAGHVHRLSERMIDHETRLQEIENLLNGMDLTDRRS